jgi:hypothetical protein
VFGQSTDTSQPLSTNNFHRANCFAAYENMASATQEDNISIIEYWEQNGIITPTPMVPVLYKDLGDKWTVPRAEPEQIGRLFKFRWIHLPANDLLRAKVRRRC